MSTRKKESNKQLVSAWGTLCSLSSIDNERNNLSLFNVIEQVNFPKEAFEQQKKEQKPILARFPHEIIILLKRTVSIPGVDNEIKSDIKIKLIDPSGAIIQETVAPLVFPENIKRLRFRVTQEALAITTVGDYQYIFEVKNGEDAEYQPIQRIPLEVTQLPEGRVQAF